MKARFKAASPIIAPSVLSADFSILGNQVKQVVAAGCSWIHLDIMDNHFVPNLTFGAPVVKSLRKVSKKAFFDAHLMVENPSSLVPAFQNAGAQLVTIHQEACPTDLRQCLQQIKDLGMQAGVSIKPATPVAEIEDYLPMVDLVLVMTVEPGFGGQSLIGSCLNKISTLKRLRENQKLAFKIQADGGVNEETAAIVAAAGADVLVAGSAVFNGKPVKENVAALMKCLQG